MAADAVDVLQLLVPIVLIVLLSSVIAYYFLRKYKRSQRAAAVLPLYEETGLAPPKSHHRRQSSISIASSEASRQSYIRKVSDPEKRALARTNSAPTVKNAGLPEIHVTFPEEVDSDGKRSPERVVVVHLNEKGIEVGMEAPLQEQLPAYERFESLDLARIGGLKEKEVTL